MPALKVKELLESWTPRQKRTILEALVRDLVPPQTPTRIERKKAELELARRFATRDQAVSVDEFLANRKKKLSKTKS
jgi:hypothetical protein